MVELVVVIVLLALLGVLGRRYGADTRDGRDWQPYDIMTLHGTRSPLHDAAFTPLEDRPSPRQP